MTVNEGYVLVRVEEDRSEIVRPSGIITLTNDTQTTTNNGDKVSSRTKLVVLDGCDEWKGKEVIVNRYELMLFNRDDKIYGVIPKNEVRVII